MTAPPPPTTAPARTTAPLEPLAGGSRNEFQPALLTVEELVREANRVLDRMGVQMSSRKVVRIVRRWHRDPEFWARFLTYADPTGEHAVRNVMRYY